MTFLAPASTAESRQMPFLFGRRAARTLRRPLIAGEDGARRALGSEHGLPGAPSSAASIEHLARIALG